MSKETSLENLNTNTDNQGSMVVYSPSTLSVSIVDAQRYIDSAKKLKSELRDIDALSNNEYSNLLKKSAYSPTLAVPSRATLPRTNRDGRINLDEHPDTHRIIYSALKKVEMTFDAPGLPVAFTYFPNGYIPEVTVDTLIEYAIDAHKKGDKKLADQLFYLALSVEKTKTPVKKTTVSESEEVELIQVFSNLLPVLENHTLSTGMTFQESVLNLAKSKAKQKITESLEKINQPLTNILQNIKESLQKTSAQKALELSRSTDQARSTQLIIDIVAIQSNIQYCNRLQQTGISYENYEQIIQSISDGIQQIQTRVYSNSENKYQNSNIATMQHALFTALKTLSITEEQHQYFGSIITDLCHQGLLDQMETRLQSISSLKSQLKEAERVRKNATLYIEGDPNIQTSGIRFSANEKKLKEISELIAETGEPIINILTAQKFAPWVVEQLDKHGIQINSTEDLIRLYEEFTGDKRITSAELLKIKKAKHRQLYQNMAAQNRISILLDELTKIDPSIDIDKFGFESFYAKAYVTGIYDTRADDIKAELMEILTPILDHLTNQDLRTKYNVFIGEVASETVDTETLIEIEQQRQLEIIHSQLRGLTGNVLKILSIPLEQVPTFIETHKEKITSILLSYFEISTKANDNHLNPISVLRSLSEAVFQDKPLNLHIVRCLRWCYPYGDVEIVPHASDWETHRPNGEPLTRKEWVEIEKLNIYNRVVIEPLKHHNIPINNITLLATGDYEVSGEGYQFEPDHPQRQNALAYVADLKQRATTWNNFGETPIVVKSFKELIAEFGEDKFNEILKQVQAQYDQLFNDYDLNYHGLTGKNIERIVDSEHGHRDPFINWWNRDRSYGFTRHKITYEMAFSVILATQENLLLSASGNQYSGTNFSHGHRIAKELGLIKDTATEAIGITFINSVNDGDQSAHFAAKTTVVN